MADNRIALAPDIAEIPRLIEWVEGCCRDSAVAGDTVFKMTLALEEAVANVIQHAFAGAPAPHRIEVQFDIVDRCVTAVVIDNGRPFDPSAAPEPDLSLPLEQRDPGGLGILLIHRMVDRIEYRRSGGRNRLHLEKIRG
jgi:anti-sigma regulatory factor (Ser/Thr protein kinase)